MLGSEFVARFIEVAQAEHARAGKKMSATDLSQLQTIHDNLQGGHDTMDDGLRDLAGFMAAQNATSADNGTDNTDSASNPGKGDGTTAVGDLPDMNAAPVVTPPASAAAPAVTIRADGSHDAYTGAHTHDHPAFGSQGGDKNHGHEHSHSGDANHDHHASSSAENAAPPPAVISFSGGLAALTAEQRATYDAGDRYLTAVRSDAIAWAVRAGVATTPEDEARWRGILIRFTPDEIEAMSAEWAQRAGERFSPRGQFIPNRRAVGGGAWTTEPTGEGGMRQTQASDPANPLRLPVPGRAISAGASRAEDAPNATEARLYALNGHGGASGKGSKRR